MLLGGGVLGLLSSVLGKFAGIGGGVLVLSGLIYTISCVKYWMVFKIACWRTVAINSGLPAVYAVDPRRPQD